MDSINDAKGLSDDAKTALHWINSWRDTRVADYGNEYEFWCARDWAAHIIAGCCGGEA